MNRRCGECRRGPKTNPPLQAVPTGSPFSTHPAGPLCSGFRKDRGSGEPNAVHPSRYPEVPFPAIPTHRSPHQPGEAWDWPAIGSSTCPADTDQSHRIAIWRASGFFTQAMSVFRQRGRGRKGFRGGSRGGTICSRATRLPLERGLKQIQRSLIGWANSGRHVAKRIQPPPPGEEHVVDAITNHGQRHETNEHCNARSRIQAPDIFQGGIRGHGGPGRLFLGGGIGWSRSFPCPRSPDWQVGRRWASVDH